MVIDGYYGNNHQAMPLCFITHPKTAPDIHFALIGLLLRGAHQVDSSREAVKLTPTPMWYS